MGERRRYEPQPSWPGGHSHVPLNGADAPTHVSAPQQSKSDAHESPSVMSGSRQSKHVPMPSSALQ
jgi:hypothetical protein